jgi:two-component system, NtrC family, sensor kinase
MSLAEGSRVLVVDDEPLILKIVASLLAPEHVVCCESRCSAALARIRSGERFDVIICDLMMPEMTGMDLYETLLELAPDQAKGMIFVTGGAFTRRARDFLAKVPNLTIDKPFSASALVGSVRSVGRAREQEKQERSAVDG